MPSLTLAPRGSVISLCVVSLVPMQLTGGTWLWRKGPSILPNDSSV